MHCFSFTRLVRLTPCGVAVLPVALDVDRRDVDGELDEEDELGDVEADDGATAADEHRHRGALLLPRHGFQEKKIKDGEDDKGEKRAHHHDRQDLHAVEGVLQGFG